MTPLQQLLSNFRNESKTEREKGTYFELLIKDFLKNDPTYSSNYSEVWTYAEWALLQGCDGRDTGIDLVAKLREEEGFCAIQCKFYDENHKIQKADLDSFFTASGKLGFTCCLIVDSTRRDWSEHAEDALRGQSIDTRRIGLNELESSPIDWSVYVPDQVVKLKAKKKLRGHHTIALNKIENGLTEADLGKLIMACGTCKIFKGGITDEGLAYFQAAYPKATITKEDVFYYIYGLLHSEDYKKRYADNLTKELSHIPCVKKAADFRAFIKAGRALAELHINYETVEPYPVNYAGGSLFMDDYEDQDYRVEQMKFGQNSKGTDNSTVIYNHKITMTGIPLEAYEYVVNGKSALEWVMESQAVTTHKKSGIVNDANLWAIETMHDAAYPLKLFQRVITVSLETVKIVRELPRLEIMGDEQIADDPRKSKPRGRKENTNSDVNISDTRSGRVSISGRRDKSDNRVFGLGNRSNVNISDTRSGRVSIRGRFDKSDNRVLGLGNRDETPNRRFNFRLKNIIGFGSIGKRFRPEPDDTFNIELSSETLQTTNFEGFSDPSIEGKPVNFEVYPNIKASNEHPVTGEVIDLSVTLEEQESVTTSGQVSLPDAKPEEIFNIQVHLLCADFSLWDTLEYCKAKGTTKPACFKVTAPALSLDDKGNYLEQEKLLVRCNFYYNNRWCGEGQRFLDLRLDETITPLKAMPQPPKGIWKNLILFEQGAQPADLLVRIQRSNDNYLWTCLSPHLNFESSANSVMQIPEGAETFVKNLFEPYANIDLNPLQKTEINGIGEKIYNATPAAFQDNYWQLYRESKNNIKVTFNSILFITDEPYVPWELMRIADMQRGSAFAPELLGIRHATGRWLASESSRLPQKISVEAFAVTGSGYDNVPNIPKLPWVKGELDWLTNAYKPSVIPLKSDDLIKFLDNGTAQAVHFACHGKMSSNPLNSMLIMEDNPQNLKPISIDRFEVKNGLGRYHPIIFLNACQSAAEGNILGLIAGFPAAFLNAGASAVISPLWTISDAYAKEITEEFYTAAFAQPGATLGEIMQSIRKKWVAENHLTFLAYVLYGDPQARINYEPVRI